MKNLKKNSIKKLKVAIVSDELQYWGGAQDSIVAFTKIFPNSTIYTSIFEKDILEKHFKDFDVKASFVQRLPFEKKFREEYFLLYPLAFRLFNLRKYDLVISVSSAFSKFIRTSGKTKHFLYCLTPPRYLWMENRSERKKGAFSYKIYSLFRRPLHAIWRRWDRNAARNADMVVGISKEVGKRIETFYGLNAKVLYPPVNIDYITFNPDYSTREDWFLYVGRVEKYKGVDLMVRACISAGKKLKIVGNGSYLNDLKKIVKELNGENHVEFLGYVDNDVKADLYFKCKALIFPVKDEDFGLVPVEANAAGCPVLAFAGGGALETVEENITGRFFKEYSVGALRVELEKWNLYHFDPEKCRGKAEEFSVKAFENKMLHLTHEIVGEIE